MKIDKKPVKSSKAVSFNEIEWEMIKSHKGGVFSDIPVYFTIYKDSRDERTKSVFILNQGLTDSCGWNAKDKLEVFQNPKDKTQFKVVKASRGYTLSRNAKGKNHRIQISRELIPGLIGKSAYHTENQWDGRSKCLYLTVDVTKPL